MSCCVGALIRLEPKAFHVLTYLIQHRDRGEQDELLSNAGLGSL